MHRTARRIAVGLVAAAWALAALGQPAPGADVDSLLAIAREANPELASLRLEAAAAAERVQPAGALPDPRLRVELMDVTQGGQQGPSLAPGRVGSTRYTLMQELPWFGKRGLRREIAEAEAQGAQGRARGTWSELAARVKTGYAQLYELHQNEQLTREILGLMGQLEQIAQARYAAGLSAQQDVVRAQVEQTGLQAELIALETERHHLQARLNTLLARPVHAPLADPQRLRPLPAAAALEPVALEDRARERSPQLAAEAARLQGAERSRALAYKGRYPDVTVGLAPNQMRNSVRQLDVMVELSIPLRQDSRRAQERESEALLQAARARQTAAENQLRAELADALASLDAARRKEALAANSQLPQAELTLKAALAGYENGKVDFATLLDAQRQIRLARQARIRALAEGQVRLAEIERIVGEDL